jgi:hypothetical protein
VEQARRGVDEGVARGVQMSSISRPLSVLFEPIKNRKSHAAITQVFYSQEPD